MGNNDDFWDDLLGHIRDRVLVPVVGPDLTVVKVGDAEQTFSYARSASASLNGMT